MRFPSVFLNMSKKDDYPFGLCNAPATFQQFMELALQGLQWSICLIYLDDVIVYGNSFAEHLQRLRTVLSHIQQAGLKLKPSKCHLFKSEVIFLGHRVSKDGVLPNDDNVTKVVDWPEPRSVTEVCGFLGLVNYCRRFIQNHARLVQPLVTLTKKDQPFKWTDKCQMVFEELKQILAGPEIMAHPLADGLFILDTDACDVSIGAVLSQVQDGREAVVAYRSKTLP